MTVSGSKNFELDVADYIEEAFERCGLEVRTGYDLKTAKRSMNLLFADWANRGISQWTIAQRSFTVTSNDGQYDLSADVIDILSLVIQRDSTDYSLDRISRDAYLNIPTKSTQSRPTQYFLDRQITPNLKLWPLPDNSTDVIYYDAIVVIQLLQQYVHVLAAHNHGGAAITHQTVLVGVHAASFACMMNIGMIDIPTL